MKPLRQIASPSRTRHLLSIAAAVVATSTLLHGQGRSAQTRGAAPASARQAAPIDLTGNWVSIITEDWRWRMVMPPRGDYASVPINQAAKDAADVWDPKKDEAAGEACRAYGAAGVMRIPGRLRISWQDDNTLKVETDAGTQTRLFHFGSWKSAARPTWQGDSVAEWQTFGRSAVAAAAAGADAGQGGASGQPKYGSLKVVTTHMRPGYLRKNGVPYSGDAVLTEYWDLYKEDNGVQWLVITSTVNDPKYLHEPYITSPNFRKEADGSKWDPSPCSATS